MDDEPPGNFGELILARQPEPQWKEGAMQVLNEALLRMLAGWHGLQARAAEEEGQTLAEYGLIMAVIAVAVVVTAVIAFRTAIVNAFSGATRCLTGSC